MQEENGTQASAYCNFFEKLKIIIPIIIPNGNPVAIASSYIRKIYAINIHNVARINKINLILFVSDI